jgi:thioredoxin 1
MKHVLLSLLLFCTFITHTETTKTAPILTVTLNSFQLLSNSKQPILLKIHADWCAPCKRMMPTFEKVATKFSKKVKSAKLIMKSFLDSDPVITFLKKEYNVSINCVPTFLLIKNNKVIKVFEGSMNFEDFSTQLTQALLPKKTEIKK